MTPIGGYFEFELFEGLEFHPDAIKVNTGRNAFEYILRANNYIKVYIPFYTCEVLLEPIIKLNIEYEFYSIDSNFEPIFNYRNIKYNEGFLYTNYFGIKNNFIYKLSNNCENLIIDNAQSFFSKPNKGIDTFYSARKFMGVSDGAYVYSNYKLKKRLKRDNSSARLKHLVTRIENSAEDGYGDFISNEESLKNEQLKSMSKFTEKLLKSINYETIIYKRKENFNFLLDNLNDLNEIKLNRDESLVPMVYPFLKKDNVTLYEKLIDNKVYVAKYWPNVLEWADHRSFEYYLAENIIALPIDHRFSREDMNRIINLIK